MFKQMLVNHWKNMLTSSIINNSPSTILVAVGSCGYRLLAQRKPKTWSESKAQTDSRRWEIRKPNLATLWIIQEVPRLVSQINLLESFVSVQLDLCMFPDQLVEISGKSQRTWVRYVLSICEIDLCSIRWFSKRTLWSSTCTLLSAKWHAQSSTIVWRFGFSMIHPGTWCFSPPIPMESIVQFFKLLLPLDVHVHPHAHAGDEPTHTEGDNQNHLSRQLGHRRGVASRHS